MNILPLGFESEKHSMSYRYLYVLLTGILLCLSACVQRNNEEFRRLLSESEYALAHHSDLLLSQLDSLDVSTFSEADRAEFNLLSALTKSKNNQSLLDDTTRLTEAITYFKKKKDYSKLSHTYLMRSRAFYDSKYYTGEADQAMSDAVDAKKYGEIAGNNKLLCEIYQELGDIYYARSYFREALTSFLRAYDIAKEEDLKQEIVLTCGRVSGAYNVMKKADSALIYQQEALQIMLPIAESSDYNRYITALLYKNMSMSYGTLGDHLAKKNVLLEAYHLLPAGSEHDELIILTQLSKVFIDLHKPDSAFYYAGLFPNLSDETIFQTTLKAYHWFMVYKAMQDYPRALENLELYSKNIESIHADELDASVVEIKEKYDKQLVENEYHKLLTQRLFLIVSMVSIILIGSLLALLFIFHLRNKKRALFEAHESLEAMRYMLTCREDELATSRRDKEKMSTEMEGLLTEKEERLRQFLVEKLDIARKIANMNLVPTDNGKLFMRKYQAIFGHDLLDEIGWPNLSAVITELYDDFPRKIATQFPNLSQKELQLCCLIRAGFRTEQICVFLNNTQNTVRVNKSRLRQKMGFSDYETFLLFLLSI